MCVRGKYNKNLRIILNFWYTSTDFYSLQLMTNRAKSCPQLRTNDKPVDTRNVVIYHDPQVGVIFMVILHVSIIKNYPNLFSNYYPKYTFWVIYPFLMNLGEFIYKVISSEHSPIVREEMAMFSFFRYPVSDRYNDFR